MRPSRLVPHKFFSLLLILLLALFTATTLAYAADEEEGESYDEQARVARISLIRGSVTLKRKGNTDWEQARVNFPLVEGDTLATDRDSQLEIQIDSRNFVRLGSESMLRIAALRDEGVALSIIEGIASIRLARLDRAHEYFEIDAPQSTLAAEETGLYRIDVPRGGRVRFTVTDGGRARIYSETSGFALRSGRAAELINEGVAAGDWQMFPAESPDTWDAWVADRERYLADRSRYETAHYDRNVWGAEDLGSYGNWFYVNDYGWLWRPHITVINQYNNWAPYRYGTWTWLWPYGWTWVGYEPWGWAPYHYGRWVYYNNYWAWCPRSYYYHDRSWWRPALVGFSFSFGNHISWYPLPYHHRDPRSRVYNVSKNPGRTGIPPYSEVAYRKAITTASTQDFGADDVRFKSVDPNVGRRILDEQPLKDLPLRPANVYSQKTGGGFTADERITAAKPRVKPAADIVERPTGADIRKAGAPLDADLRRSRVFGGREAKTIMPETGTDGSSDSRTTGAVKRPPLTIINEPEKGGQSEPNQRGDKGMPRAPNAGDDGTRVIKRQDYKGVREPVDQDSPSPVVKPQKDSGDERPTKTIRSQPRERDDSSTPTYQPPVRKYEPPPRSEPPARYEPPKQSEPVRKYEPPPQRSEQPRSEPPPQRSEPPRSEPPQRSAPPSKSDPPPQKSEPAKVQPPKKMDPN